MELRHLRYFLTVAEELSFTKASQKLFISQPPLSRQIKELENEIGTELFIRNNKRVELTDAGKYFKQKIESQLQELEVTILQTKRIGENLSGEYRIGYISSTFSNTITQLVQFLMKKYPYLNIKLYEASTAKQIAALEQSKLDIGVVRAPVISTKVDSKLWLRDSFSLVYNNQIIKEHVTDLKDLQNEVFVFFNKDYAPTYHSLLLQICAYHGFIPNLVHESNNVNSIIQLVRNGLGISIVPSSIIHNHAYRELSFIDLGGEYTTEVLIATPKNNKSVITEVVSEYLLS
jgi:LysR family transcriptional regulator, benzoate and cis,cis-muconate-responsive activator of ben and cat genes